MASWLERIIGRVDNPGAPIITTRALDADFTPSATAYTLCIYTINMVVASTQSSTVVLNSDAVATPTTPRCSASTNVVGTARQVLVYVCPPGENVKLVSSGTGTPTIVHQVEIPIS